MATAAISQTITPTKTTTITPAESAFVGSYHRGGVDSMSQIVVLNDRTFCYAFMGGALDLFVGGRWQLSGKKADESAGRGRYRYGSPVMKARDGLAGCH